MIIVDIEATGPDPQKCSILSIGAVDLDEPTRQFYGECRAFDGAALSVEGLKICGFTVEQATDKSKQTDVELVKSFVEWCSVKGKPLLAGQNPAGLDIPWLRNAAVRAKILDLVDEPLCNGESIKRPNTYNTLLGYRSVDLHAVAYASMLSSGWNIPVKEGRSNVNSQAICTYCGIPTENEVHNALSGAKWEAECFSRIIYGKQLLDEYKKYPVPEYFRK